MSEAEDQRGEGGPLVGASERALWQRSGGAEIAEDEAERFLDLAAFADGRLDPDEQERVADRLARDGVLAGDVAAARAMTAGGMPDEAVAPEIIARARALIEGQPARAAPVIPFPERFRPRPSMSGVTRWAGLAAALVVASWLGFDLGSTTSAALTPTAQPAEDALVHDMLEPSTSLLGDLTEGMRT